MSALNNNYSLVAFFCFLDHIPILYKLYDMLQII